MKLQKLLFLLLISTAMTACCDVFKKNCPKVKGCTDSNAINFNVDAEEDDGSCEYLNVSSVTLYGRYSNNNGNNPQYQITDLPDVSHGTVSSYLLNTRAYIELKNVKITDADGIHHEITDLEVQEKNGNTFSVVPNFVSTSTENTSVAIILVLQQSLTSYAGGAQNNQAKYARMVSFAQKLVEKFKENSDQAKNVNPQAQRNYSIAIVGYGSKDSLSYHDFIPLTSLTLNTIKDEIAGLPRLENNFAALGQAIMLANSKINAYPFQADYKCIIALGDGSETDSDNGLAPAISALQSGSTDGMYCLAVLEDNYPTLLGNGEKSFTDLSTTLEDGIFKKASIVEQITPVFEEVYKNIPNNYNLKYERSTQTTQDIEIRWVMTTKPKE